MDSSLLTRTAKCLLLLFYVSGSGGLLAEEAVTVDWQMLHRHDDVIARGIGYWPLNESEVELGQGDTVQILNESNRLLRIRFIEVINDKDEQVLSEAKLQALVSENPGMGYSFSFNPNRLVLSAAVQNRIIALTNVDFKRIRFQVFEGKPGRLNLFAPLSWLQPEQQSEQSESGQEIERVRTHSGEHTFDNWSSPGNGSTLTLEEGRHYWLESVMPGSERWAFARSQPWLWFLKTKTAETLTREVLTYESTAKTRIITDVDTPRSNASAAYRHILPGLFSVERSGDWFAETLSDSFYRVQSLSEDWLFADNYKTYGLPAVLQMQQEQQLTQRLKKNQLPTAAPPLTRAAQRSAINRQLVNKTLSGQTKNLVQVYFRPQTFRWAFNDLQNPDLWHQETPVSITARRLAFSRLRENDTATWNRPDDALSNELTLEVHWPETGGELVIAVDGNEYRRLVPFNAMKQYEMQTNWQNQKSEAGSAANGSKSVATVRLFLPENWQNIQLQSISSEPLVRLRYKALRRLQLDSGQWLQLLSASAESDMLERFKSQSAAWQRFTQYLQWRSAEFQVQELPVIWQKLLTDTEPFKGFYDGEMPASLPDYQIIQQHLMQPDIENWQHWSELARALRQSGWDNHAMKLMRALLRHHPDADIKNSAAHWLLDIYTEKQNDVAITSLLIYRYQSTPPRGEQFEYHALQLAARFLQVNQPEYALFTLLGVSDSSARAQLVHQAAERTEFLSLSDADRSKSSSVKTTIPTQSINSIEAKKPIRLRNVKQDLVQTNYLVTPTSPLRIELSQSANLTLLARQWFTKSNAPMIEHNHDWLSLSFAGEKQLVPLFYSDYRSDTLAHPKGKVGQAHRIEVELPEAGVLEIRTREQATIINIKEWLPASHIQRQTESCQRQNTQYPDTSLWLKQSEEPDEFSCSRLQYQPTKNSQFLVVSDDGWANMPMGQQLIEALAHFETDPEKAKSARLNQMVNQWPESSAKARFLRRLNHSARWQLLSNPMRVKKFNVFEAKTNAPLSPSAYRNRLLNIPYRAGWEKLSDKTALNYQLKTATDEEFRLLLEAQQHLFTVENQKHSEIFIKVDNEPDKRVVLQMGEAQEVPLLLKPGNHQIALIKTGGSVIDSVIAKLQFRQNKGPWQEQPLNVRLRLFKADKKQPYETFLSEDSWLRVDSFTEAGMVHHQYLHAPQGLFSWYSHSEDFIGHRIYQLVLEPGSEFVSNTQRTSQITLANNSQTTPKRTGFYVEPLNSVGKNKKELMASSWGVWLGKQQRKSPDEESLQNNRYLEIGSYRQNRHRGTQEAIRYQLAARLYDGEFNDSYHGRVSWWNTGWHHNMDLNFELSLAGQRGSVSNDFAWSGQVSAGVHWQYAIDRRFFNRFSAEGWFNILESDKDPLEYANSVFSQYKLDHRHGIRISELIRYKWRHDLENWVSLQANTNPFGQNKWLDNGVSEIGARLFYQGLAADIHWRYQRFLNDEDRQRSTNDSRLGIGLDWFNWDKARHLRWRLGYERNLLTDENYWSISFSYNRSGGRGVQDYLPQTLAFSALRQQAAILAAMDTEEQ